MPTEHNTDAYHTADLTLKQTEILRGLAMQEAELRVRLAQLEEQTRMAVAMVAAGDGLAEWSSARLEANYQRLVFEPIESEEVED